MKSPGFNLLAAWTAGAGLILALTPAHAQTSLPGARTAGSAIPPVTVQPNQPAAPDSAPFAPAVPAQPAPSHPVLGQPAGGPPGSGIAYPQLTPYGPYAPETASRPCLRDRIHCLWERLYTPWPSITW
jgi:hypothetical protein